MLFILVFFVLSKRLRFFSGAKFVFFFPWENWWRCEVLENERWKKNDRREDCCFEFFSLDERVVVVHIVVVVTVVVAFTDRWNSRVNLWVRDARRGVSKKDRESIERSLGRRRRRDANRGRADIDDDDTGEK